MTGKGNTALFPRRPMLRPLALAFLFASTPLLHAIGLGEAQLLSALGERPDVRILLVDLPADWEARCFHIRTSPSVPLQATLVRRGTTAQLRLHGNVPLNEPAWQLTLVAVCEGEVSRDYVFLPDPAVLPRVQPAASEPSNTRLPRPAVTLRPIAAGTPARPPRPNTGSTADRPAPAVETWRPAAPLALFQLDTTLPRVAAPPAAPPAPPPTPAGARSSTSQAVSQAVSAPSPEPTARPTAATTLSPFSLAVGLCAALASLGGGLVWRRRTRGQAFRPQTVSLPESHTENAAPTGRIAEPDPEPGSFGMSTEIRDDIVDQAEVLTAHGQAAFAIGLLRDHLALHPADSVIPWLHLLDLLHREGDEAGYVEARNACKLHFNIKLPDHPVFHGETLSRAGLEAYPHLIERLQAVWNTPGREAFFDDLIYDRRGGTRMGFEPEVFREILLLRELARQP